MFAFKYLLDALLFYYFLVSFSFYDLFSLIFVLQPIEPFFCILTSNSGTFLLHENTDKSSVELEAGIAGSKCLLRMSHEGSQLKVLSARSHENRLKAL